MSKYFGTDGFRGEAGITLTADHAYKVGRFLGWYYNGLRERNGDTDPARIVIGKDTRRSSYMFEYSLVAGLTASGADAYLLHVTTTPSVAYIARVDDFDVQNPVYRAKGEIMSLTDKVSQMAKKREQLYADYVAGVVDSEDYQLIREDYSRQYDGLRAALQEAENKKVQVEQQIEEYLNMTSHLEEHLDNFEFDIQLVKSLVQKIEVSADKRIRIVFGFRDVFTELGKESAET